MEWAVSMLAETETAMIGSNEVQRGPYFPLWINRLLSLGVQQRPKRVRKIRPFMW